MISKIENKIIMIHTGWGSKVSNLLKIIKNNKNKIFVLAHMKEDFDFYNSDRKKALYYENVYLEISYMSTPKRIRQYAELGYLDRILFGSDFRTFEDEITLKWYIYGIHSLGLSRSERDKIFYYNAYDLIF